MKGVQPLNNRYLERVWNGFFKENPIFVLMLGMCPTLAVTTSAINGFSMGISTMVVLVLSNLVISLLRKVIPSRVRIPAFIIIIASFVTIIGLILEAYIHPVYEALGLYIQLIVVNCIILGRAESYAYSHSPGLSAFDGLGMGLGFTFALTILGSFREIIGAGSIFGYQIMPSFYVPVSIFVLSPGAFFVLSILTSIQNKVKSKNKTKERFVPADTHGCNLDCASCASQPREEVK